MSDSARFADTQIPFHHFQLIHILSKMDHNDSWQMGIVKFFWPFWTIVTIINSYNLSQDLELAPLKAGGFPMWLVALIVVVILLIAAAVTWSCVCKRSSNEARLLGA